MKSIICFLILLPTILQASPSEVFNQRRKEVLEKRKMSIIKKVSEKLKIPDRVASRDLRFKRQNDSLTVSGFVEGYLGACKASGKISLESSQTKFVCISPNSKVTYFFL